MSGQKKNPTAGSLYSVDNTIFTRARDTGSDREREGNYMCVFIETSCSVQRGAVEWKTKPFQTVLSNHNIFTALSDCLAQTDAISPTRFPATPLSPTLLFAFISISFRLIADAFHMFKRRESKEEGLGIYSRIPMTQTPHTWASSDNRRIWLYTSVYNIFFFSLSPLHERYYIHADSIRQSVCFVTILGSFVRPIKRVSCSFYSNHSIFYIFFSLFSLLVGPVVRIKRTCEDQTSHSNMFTQWGRGRNSMQQHGSTIDFSKLFNHLYRIRLIKPDVFFSS